ncbi:uncharacterized protein LOC110191190 [Drosophila serrata]|uniref:uncharacterized protein LOC110191190 n=1 Tax=Drosophila serrata TaxID=7274 RepID=UPI000A1D1C0B|nr:uncharacterized protein LOC110191190 [Drosophila serrata]
MSYREGKCDEFFVRCQMLERSCKSAEELTQRNGEALENLSLQVPILARKSVDSIAEEAKKDVEFKMDQIKQELCEREKFIVSMREQLHLEVPKSDPVKHNLLMQKYRAALKKDEKLEAEAQRSLTEVNVDMEKQTAELKQLHSTQVIEYLLMQDQIKENFKKDMDKLMKKFDAEMSRFSKDNSDVLAIKEKNNSSSVGSTHQP